MAERIRGRKLQKLRRIVLSQEPLCRHSLAAGKVKAAEEVDHIKPLCAGGTNARDNLQALCSDCHKDKTRRDVAMNNKRKADQREAERLAEPIREHELLFNVDGYPVEE